MPRPLHISWNWGGREKRGNYIDLIWQQQKRPHNPWNSIKLWSFSSRLRLGPNKRKLSRLERKNIAPEMRWYEMRGEESFVSPLPESPSSQSVIPTHHGHWVPTLNQPWCLKCICFFFTVCQLVQFIFFQKNIGHAQTHLSLWLCTFWVYNGH